jgi:hypothetical protein
VLGEQKNNIAHKLARLRNFFILDSLGNGAERIRSPAEDLTPLWDLGRADGLEVPPM